MQYDNINKHSLRTCHSKIISITIRHYVSLINITAHIKVIWDDFQIHWKSLIIHIHGRFSSLFPNLKPFNFKSGFVLILSPIWLVEICLELPIWTKEVNNSNNIGIVSLVTQLECVYRRLQLAVCVIFFFLHFLRLSAFL